MRNHIMNQLFQSSLPSSTQPSSSTMTIHHTSPPAVLEEEEEDDAGNNSNDYKNNSRDDNYDLTNLYQSNSHSINDNDNNAETAQSSFRHVLHPQLRSSTGGNMDPANAMQQQQHNHHHQEYSTSSSSNSVASNERLTMHLAFENMANLPQNPSTPLHRTTPRNSLRCTTNHSRDALSVSTTSSGSSYNATFADYVRMQQELGIAAATTPSSRSGTRAPLTEEEGRQQKLQEQQRIWAQIQAEQERKQMEMVLKLSQEADEAERQRQEKAREQREFEEQYPDYPRQEDSNKNEERTNHGEDDDKAFQEALRLSEEEAAKAQEEKPPEEEEDDVAMALRLSKEQAERDERMKQKLREVVGEDLSEEEQLKRIIEQSMNEPEVEEEQQFKKAMRASLKEQKYDKDSEYLKQALEESAKEQLQKGSSGADEEEEQLKRAMEESIKQEKRQEQELSEQIEMTKRLSQRDITWDNSYSRRSSLSSAASENVDLTRTRQAGECSSSTNDASASLPQHWSHPSYRTKEDLTQEETLTTLASRSEESSSYFYSSQQSDDSAITPSEYMQSLTQGPGQEEAISETAKTKRKSFFGRRKESRLVPSSAIPDAIPPLDSLLQKERPVRSQPGRSPRSPSTAAISTGGTRPGYDIQRHSLGNPVSSLRNLAQGGLQRQGHHLSNTASVRSCPTLGTQFEDEDDAAREAMVREGQMETRRAMEQGQSQVIACQGCMGRLHAPLNCALVFCPTCQTVSPVTGESPGL